MDDTLEMHQGDRFYLVSDGFQDQFDHTDSKKYLSGRLGHFIERIYSLPMSEQKAYFAEELQNWKGKNKQTDDILVVGLKI
jgi:serine phosphatase RsbU (regulator of sigma subunit)